MTDTIVVLMTAPSADKASEIARTLVEVDWRERPFLPLTPPGKAGRA